MPKHIQTFTLWLRKILRYQKTDEILAEKKVQPITKQYLQICASNAVYTSYTSAESLIDTMNFYLNSFMTEAVII